MSQEIVKIQALLDMMYVYHYLCVRLNCLISLNSLVSEAISKKHLLLTNILDCDNDEYVNVWLDNIMEYVT